MALFMITYDLNKERDYPGLYRQLGAWSAVRLLESVWLVERDEPAGEIIAKLQDVTDNDDALAVLELMPAFNWAAFRVGDASIELMQKYSP